MDRFSDRVQKFVAAATPYSHWGIKYFDIRLKELEMADSLFGDIISRGGERALDIGCGLGLACVFLSEYYNIVDGTDIEEKGVAFNVENSAALSGHNVIRETNLDRVALHCGDTLEFLKSRPEHYDFIFSHFVLEHVEDILALSHAIYKSLKPGGRSLHIVPNTHDTIMQLLLRNLEPFWPNVKRAVRNSLKRDRCDGKLQGTLFTPITHSEFLKDYRQQFEVNSSERYLFPLIEAGFRVRDIKPMREHAYGILVEKKMHKISH